MRECRICGLPLSVYNDTDICFCHQDGMPVVSHIPVTLCTSYDPSEKPDVVQEVAPFEEVLTGFIYGNRTHDIELLL